MKKFLSMLLVLMLAFSLVACNKSDDDKEPADSKEPASSETPEEPKNTEEDKEDAIEAAEKFLDATLSFDEKKVKKAVSKDTEIPEGMFDLDAQIDAMVAAAAIPEEYTAMIDAYKDFAAELMQEIIDSASYEILDAEADGDNYIVTYEMEALDINGIDMEALLGEYLTEENATELAKEALEQGLLTESSSEEEAMEVITGMALDLALEEIKEADTTTVENTLTVINEDGKWVVKK